MYIREVSIMCRIVVTYNNRKVTSFKCPAERLAEGLEILGRKYPNYVLTIC
jgi:hypothetical protein